MPATRKPDPAVLLVGADSTFLPAIEGALARYRVFVETSDVDNVVDSVVAAAPDLVMLMGDAAADCGNATLQRLAGSPMSSVVPVIILEDDMELDARLRAFRHGAAAVIPRSASVDSIAEQVAKLAREIPERPGSTLGEVGDTTLKEFAETLARQLRSGILSVSPKEGADTDPVRLVLGQGRPLAELIDDFVTRARRHVLAAEPLHYEFDERATGTVRMLDLASSEEQKSPDSLQGVRLALADSDTARADHVAQELRSLGATVAVTDLAPSESRFARIRQMDPTMLLIGESHVHQEGYELVRRMQRDTRLRWVSLLVVRWDELWTDNTATPMSTVERLAGTLLALAEPEVTLRERTKGGHGFDTRLETTGPARCLRALTSAGRTVRASVHNPRLSVEVDLQDQLVVGAVAETIGSPGERFEGPTALSALLQLSSGRVSVREVDNPATANLMTTVDVALNMADTEVPPIAPSIPPATPELAPTANLTTAVRAASPAPTSSPLERARRWIHDKTPRTGTDPGSLVPVTMARELSRAGISVPLTIALVGLAVLQTAAMVLLIRGQFAGGEHVTEAARTVVAQTKTETQAIPPPSIASTKPQVPAPSQNKGAPPAVMPTSAPEARVEAATGIPKHDGSGAKAPSCESLWGEHPPRSGKYPGAALEQMRQANKWITRGDVDRAQHSYCLATAWDSTNPSILFGMGQLLLIRRDAEAAIPWLEKALKQKPDSRRTRQLYGDALARTGELEAARTAWLAADEVGGPDAERLIAARDLRIAQRKAARREWTHAEKLFRRVVVLDATSMTASVGLSRALSALGDNDAAVLWARRALELDARSADARIALGDALARAGDVDEARVEWEEASLLDPTHRVARHRLRHGAP